MPVSSGTGAAGTPPKGASAPSPEVARVLRLVELIASGDARDEVARLLEERANHEAILRDRRHSDNALAALNEAQRIREKAAEEHREAQAEAARIREQAQQAAAATRKDVQDRAARIEADLTAREQSLSSREADYERRSTRLAEREAKIAGEYERAHSIESEARELAQKSRAYAARIRSALDEGI